MASFNVDPKAVRRLAHSYRLAGDLARLAWPQFLATGAVGTKSRSLEVDHVFLDEWDKTYRDHLTRWADSNAEHLEALFLSLAEHLAAMLAERTSGGGGRPPSG
jgi:hypothetical protein